MKSQHTGAQSQAAPPQGSIGGQLLALAVPTFGQIIAEPAFILIDTAIVGHIGDAALAGLSVGSTIVLTTVGLCIFLAYGTTTQVSRLIGAGRRREGIEVGIDGIWLALLIGIVVSGTLFAAARPLCWAMGARDEVLTQAVGYLQAVVFGLPGMLLVFAANGIFRGFKKVRITLVAAVLGAAVNTALDMLFVFGFGWGVAGSGVATLVAQWFMAVMLLVPALLWARADGADWRPRLSGILHTAGDGVPLFVRTLALRACMVGTVVLAAHMGTKVLASYQAVNSTWNFVLNMLDAIGIAAQTLVGTSLGAGRRDQARLITRATQKAGIAGGCLIGLGMLLVGWAVAPLFTPTPQVQMLIIIGMSVQGLLLPLAGWMWTLDGILIGAGDYRYLAITCMVTATVYLSVLGGINAMDGPLITDDRVRIAVLWLALNVVFIGMRGIFNGLRIRTTAWMDATGA